MASDDRTSILPQLGENARGKTTSAPVARLTPTPFSRTEGGLYIGRHRLSGDPRQRSEQRTVDELTARYQELLARYQARLHCSDVQNRLDAGQAS